jgi:hypothetical protein
MSAVDLFATMSLAALVLPMVFWVLSLAGFVLHVPAVLISSGYSGLRRMLVVHLRSVRLMSSRHLGFALRKRAWLPKPPYPDLAYDRLALSSGLPAVHLRAARYGLGLVLPGLVCSLSFLGMMGIAHGVGLVI